MLGGLWRPSCRCADPSQRHGPYYQLSWKEAGKTVSRLLSAEEAALYKEWIDNRRHLESVLQESAISLTRLTSTCWPRPGSAPTDPAPGVAPPADPLPGSHQNPGISARHRHIPDPVTPKQK